MQNKTTATINRLLVFLYLLQVSVRIRPLSQKERQQICKKDTQRDHIVAKAVDENNVMVYDPMDYFMDDVLRKERPREKLYTFDQVFGDTSTQKEVFEKSVEFQVDAVLNGFNATVFAYGATGAGKTYTMMGTEKQPGIMSLTLQSLFEKISMLKSKGFYKVSISYLEIYNEKIRDLLTNKGDYLELQEDSVRGVVVSGITYMSASNPKSILQLLRKGNKNRIQEATGANETSSRSHAILQVYISFRSTENKTRFSKLSMIDLAGSERAAETNNRGMRMIEGANINRSLLALGNCINSLVDSGKRNEYVNYRDSKLTRLLKDSLGGNCRTVMIANISPASNNIDETMNTLKYASRARNIKTKISQQLSESYLTALQEFRDDFSDKISSTITQHSSTSTLHNVDPNQLEELQRIFCKQLELCAKQLDQEEKEAETHRSSLKCQFDQFQLENQIKYIKDEEKKVDYRKRLDYVDESLKKITFQYCKIQETKKSLAAEMSLLDKHIQDIQDSLETQDHYANLIRSEIKSHRLELKNLSLEITNATMKASGIQKDMHIQKSNEILDLYRTITCMQRQAHIQANTKQPEAIQKLENELLHLIQSYNDNAQRDFIIDSLDLPDTRKLKLSAFTRLKSVLGFTKMLSRTSSLSKEIDTIKEIQSDLILSSSISTTSNTQPRAVVEKTDSQETVILPSIYPSKTTQKAKMRRETSIVSTESKKDEKQRKRILFQMYKPTVVHRPPKIKK